MRLFIAIDLDETARAAIAAEQRGIVSSLRSSSLKIVRPEQMHLTLVFLGEVAEPKAKELVEIVAQPIQQAPFDLAFGGVGVFPPRGAPRVLWLGAADGGREAAVVQQELARRAASLDIPLEGRPFHAHLTLGRWRESRTIDRERAMAGAADHVVARVHVDHATLYHSRLSSAGPTYTPLARATLTP